MLEVARSRPLCCSNHASFSIQQWEENVLPFRSLCQIWGLHKAAGVVRSARNSWSMIQTSASRLKGQIMKTLFACCGQTGSPRVIPCYDY